MAFAITTLKMKVRPMWLLPLRCMRIAIIVPPFGNQLPDQASQILVNDWIVDLARRHPAIQWAVVGPVAIGNASETPHLSHLALEGRPAGLAGRWWHRRKLNKLITGWKAQRVITLDPDISGPAALPQALVLHPDWTLAARSFFSGRRSKQRMKQLADAQQVAVPLPWQQEWLQKQYGIAPQKILLTGAGTTPHFRPASWAQRESWKQEFAGGPEYFLYASPARASPELLTLLKGFSAFKKRQRSSMKLVLMITEGSIAPALHQKLDSYKYRDDLVLLYPPDLSRLADCCAGSYAVLAHDVFSYGWWLTGGMQCGVPVVAVHQPATIDWLGEAGVYVEAWKADLLAEAMMLLYKDEAQRRQLLELGMAAASQTDTTRWVGEWLALDASK
jgi:glycosyltransferase involved in cell wall biosynthesis